VTGAVIALAVAIAAAIGGLIALALKALSAERRCGDARSDEASLAARLESMVKQRDDESTRADYEKGRADALDDALADAALNNVGPVDGSLGRLLQAWTRIRAKSGDGTRVLPTPAATVSPGPDDLLPFE
jgi:hypothetical protein